MNAWDITQWQAALSIVETLTLLIVAVLVLYLRTAFASRRELAQASALMSDGLRALEERVAVCEQHRATAPDPGRVIDMDTSIARLTASVDALRREMEGLDNRLGRIESHLLRQTNR